MVQKLEKRGTQLLNGCERQFHLRFDARRPSHLKSTPSLDRVPEERGLADAGFAVQDQHAAASAVKQPVEDLALAVPAE
jgi:hypothetical protein